jgi:imidazolonepropionase-like amidohydrolase
MRMNLVVGIAALFAPLVAMAADADLAIKGGNLLTVTRGVIPGGILLIHNGKIAAIGANVEIPKDAQIIDASGKYVMPGIIDTHSHMGVYAWPNTNGRDDGNEATDPFTPQVRSEDGIFLEDPAFGRARAGGVTTVHIIPGSANLCGGMGAVLKLRDVNTLDEMKVAGAPRSIKMAFGENPKRVYRDQHRIPSTRMGNSAVVRALFTNALEYEQRWKDYEANRNGTHPLPRPEKDLKLDTLLDIMHGKIRVNVHCYTKGDLLAVMRLADEFKFKIAAFHHCLDGYKLADELAKRDIGVCTWADWWGFKMEAFDGIMENAPILAKKGVRVSIHSDSADGIQRLYMEAAKAVGHGMSDEQALKAITFWPASILGIEEKVGSLEVGKDADIAIFSRHPFDVYTRVDQTFIDGKSVYDRERGSAE